VYHLLSMYSTVYCIMDTLKAQLEHLCLSPLIFISKERLFANVTAVITSLYHELGIVGYLCNSSNHVLHYIVPDTRTLQSEFSVLHNVQISYSSFMYILSAIFVLTRCKGVWE